MQDYSPEKRKQSTPSFNRLWALAQALQSFDLKKESFIRRQYENNASGYETSVSFFELFGFVILKDGNIQTVGDLKRLISKGVVEKPQFKKLVTDSLLDGESRSEFIDDFLSLFEKANNELVLHLSTEERLKYSDIRNLFVELGLIEYVSSIDAYKVEARLIPQVEQAVNKIKKRILGVEQFARLLADQEKIGSEAELQVLEYERERLKSFPKLCNTIEHTAKVNVAAGYDINSWEVPSDQKNKPNRRSIEVKAVSHRDYRFMWTSNEIESAQKLRDNYYLYLVPVISSGVFDIKRMQIISDPYKNVFLNKKVWSKSEKVYTIWKVGEQDEESKHN
jgi:hypothetical protein